MAAGEAVRETFSRCDRLGRFADSSEDSAVRSEATDSFARVDHHQKPKTKKTVAKQTAPRRPRFNEKVVLLRDPSIKVSEAWTLLADLDFARLAKLETRLKTPLDL